MTDTRATHAYGARCACGNVIEIMVDAERFRAHNAKEIAKLMRKGYIIERMTIADARATFALCACAKIKKSRKGES